MPRSVFLGRPWPGPGEPLWTDEDRGWALALAAYEDSLCPGCNVPLDESTDPAGEEAWNASCRRCHVCATRERAAHKATSGDHPMESAGLLWTVHRR